MAIMLGTSVSGIITSCGNDDDDGIIYAGDGKNSNEEEDNSNASIGNSYAMRYEVPKIRKGKGIYFVYHEANMSNSSTQKTMNYCLEYDSAAFHSRWVAFRFDANTRAKNVSRSNTWAEDPKLPASCRLTTDYFQGHDRGHICASYDRLFSTEANQQTFYMSNMSPQIGDFNANYWVALEQLIQNWGRLGNYTNLYVCKGGTIDKDKNQVKGYINHAIANGNVNITANGIGSIDTATIELTYSRMIDFKGDITTYFFISCTCHDVKLATIDKTIRIPLIVWCSKFGTI